VIRDRWNEPQLNNHSDVPPYTRDFDNEQTGTQITHGGGSRYFGGRRSKHVKEFMGQTFDPTYDVDRYVGFKSVAAGILLLTLFTQNCTQIRLLVLARNRKDYTDHSSLWGFLVFFLSIVIILNIVAACLLFLISLAPLERAGNQRSTTWMNMFFTILVAFMCLLNVLVTSLIFAESNTSIDGLDDGDNDAGDD
jgi:hypothetical protein